MQQSLRGKQIKDYILGDTLVTHNDMHLLAAQTKDGKLVTVLMVEKKALEQDTFIAYNNLISENREQVHPKYIEVIQSANNVYMVVEKIERLPAGRSYQELLGSVVELYRRMGDFKIEPNEVFVTAQGKVVYMPFYRRMQTTSRFYAQFNNRSVLGDLFSTFVPIPNKNIALDIFIKYIDSPNASEVIATEIAKEIRINTTGANEGLLYPNMDMEDSDDEEAIMQLMSKVKVNSDMKKEAGEQFIRLSAKRQEEKEGKQIKNIMEKVESSMFKIVPEKRTIDKTKLEIRLNESKVDNNTFQLYFKSYFQSLRFFRKSIKEFLSYNRNGFAGIISSYLLVLVLTLRKAYLIRQLELRNDIFQLGIDMRAVSVQKYVALLKKDMKAEARMVCEFRQVIENCSMPMKTYTILAPFLEEDISVIDFNQLQTFTFFFLSELLKGKETKHIHFIYIIDCMYILLHRNFEIVFFSSDFPSKWDQKYFDQKVALISSLVPTWPN